MNRNSSRTIWAPAVCWHTERAKWTHAWLHPSRGHSTTYAGFALTQTRHSQVGSKVPPCNNGARARMICVSTTKPAFFAGCAAVPSPPARNSSLQTVLGPRDSGARLVRKELTLWGTHRNRVLQTGYVIRIANPVRTPEACTVPRPFAGTTIIFFERGCKRPYASKV